MNLMPITSDDMAIQNSATIEINLRLFDAFISTSCRKRNTPCF